MSLSVCMLHAAAVTSLTMQSMGPTSASINGRLGLPPIRAALQCLLGLVSIVSACSSGHHNFVHMNCNYMDAPMAVRTRNHVLMLDQVCSFLGKDHVKPKRAPSRHGSFIHSRGTQQGPPAKSLSHRSSSDEVADLPCNTGQAMVNTCRASCLACCLPRLVPPFASRMHHLGTTCTGGVVMRSGNVRLLQPFYLPPL